MNFKNRLSALKWSVAAQTAGVGALGGLAAFWLSEPIGNVSSDGSGSGFWALLWSSMLWSGAVGAVLGAILLVHDNTKSLRGAWQRDLPLGLALFFVLGWVGGGAGQLFYYCSQFWLSHSETATFAQSIARAIGWSFVGVGVGLGIGMLRRDLTQARRGALGGLIGGFVGGFLFDAITGISSAGGGALSRSIGLILMGAAIAFGRLLVQEALKSAWLLGISAGPYEGKEAPLTKNQVSVGRDANCDIALLRDESVSPQHGFLRFKNGAWQWRGESVQIDGVTTTDSVLKPDSVLQIGTAKFRFLDRSRQTGNAFGSAISASAPKATAIPVRLILRSVAEETWPQIEVSGAQSEITVGRASGNDFVLSEATVSSHHARLFWSSAGLQLRDENSSNGTRLNGEKIAPGTLLQLREGDRVEFGKVKYVVSR